MRLTTLLPLALAGTLAAPAFAQTLLDIGTLREIDDAELLSPDGSEIGEIEDVLVDRGGNPVALTFEIRERFLDLDGEEVVFSLDQLSYENGNYTTSLTAEEIGNLPRYDE